MRRRGLSEQDAYAYIRESSRINRIPMWVIAERIVCSGTAGE